MLTEQQINQQIKEKYAEWMGGPFFTAGREDIVFPNNLMELFKRVLFKVPPEVRKQNSVYLHKLTQVNPYEASRLDIGIILGLINAASYDVLYDDLETALTDFVAIEKVSIVFNKDIAEKDKELTTERNGKLRLINIHPQQANSKLHYAKK